MTDDWIIDVLKDLRKVAAGNAMLELAETLDDAILVAAAELGEQPGELVTLLGHDKNREFSGPDRGNVGRV